MCEINKWNRYNKFVKFPPKIPPKLDRPVYPAIQTIAGGRLCKSECKRLS